MDPDPFSDHGSYLLSQMGEVGVHGPVERFHRVGKEVEDFRAGDDLPLSSCQENKDVKLPSSKRDLVAVDLGSASGDIDRELVKTDGHSGCGRLSEQSTHSGGELVETEGFSDVVVGSEGQGVDSRFLIGSGGDHEDGSFGGRLFERPAEFVARSVGELDVDQDDVKSSIYGGLEALLQCLDGGDGEPPVRKAHGEGPGNHGVVFDEQDLFVHVRAPRQG